MSGRRVLALYAALLFGFAGVLCRLFYLASRTDYAARAAAQSTVTLELPARRGGFYDCMGLPLTGLEKRWLALCFPGQENYTRLYACTDTAGQELLYRSRSRAAPFLVEVDRDMTALGIPCLRRPGGMQPHRCARSCWGIWTVRATVLPGWKKHWTRCSPAAGHGTLCCAR